MGTPPITPGSSIQPDMQPSALISGRLLALARAAWVVIVSLAVALSIAGQPALYDRFRALAMYEPAIRDTVQANLVQLGLTAEFYATYLLALGLLLAVVCFAVAAVVFVYRSDEPMALFVALMLVLLGATFSGAIGAPGDRNPVLEWLHSVLSALSLLTVFLLFYLFPDGRFVPRWTRWPVTLSLLYVGATSLVPGSPFSPEHWPGESYALFLAGMLLTGVIAQVYRYRHISGYAQRQQTKWVILGLVVALGGYLVVGLLPALSPSFQPGTLADMVGAGAVASCMLLIPLSFGIAILRYHLWDIDAVINRTLVYGLVTGLLLAVYLTSVILLQSLFRGLTGQTSELAIIISTLAIAMLFQPLRRRVQDFIDRRFYRRTYNAAQTLATFSAHLRHQVDLPVLAQELTAVVQETMQPSSVSLWIRPAPPRHVQTRVTDEE